MNPEMVMRGGRVDKDILAAVEANSNFVVSGRSGRILAGEEEFLPGFSKTFQMRYHGQDGKDVSLVRWE